MPITELLSVVPIAEILKQVISQVKKMKNFKPLFKELASTMERLLPIIQEIDMLQESLEPGNKELKFLTKTMGRAEIMVRMCSDVRGYNARKINSYTKKINEINKDFVKFCQVDLLLIQHRDKLRSRSLKRQEALPRREENSNISTRDEDEQRAILESFKDKGKGKQVQEDEQFPASLQESLDMEELILCQAIEESISLSQREVQVAKSRAELEMDEQIAKALHQYESEKLTNGSSSSTRDPWEAQRMIRRVSKNKGKGKKYE